MRQLQEETTSKNLLLRQRNKEVASEESVMENFCGKLRYAYGRLKLKYLVYKLVWYATQRKELDKSFLNENRADTSWF